jgi:hypothetical protein
MLDEVCRVLTLTPQAAIELRPFRDSGAEAQFTKELYGTDESVP